MTPKNKHSNNGRPAVSAAGFFTNTLLFTLFILNVVTASPLLSHETEVTFGVLANKGVENALERWNPTADYLNRQLPEYSFKIVPLRFQEVEPAVKNGEIDFILTNTSHYIELESLYGANRILTLMDSGLTIF
jgi:ABC-type phosphate/phosphonate transport system substrate-binding protein